jgi:chlorite dismutase
MAEKASQARSLSTGKKIRSYTAYSYGLDDNEFLVIYELEDLEVWNIIVEKLREAQHRSGW